MCDFFWDFDCFVDVIWCLNDLGCVEVDEGDGKCVVSMFRVVVGLVSMVGLYFE